MHTHIHTSCESRLIFQQNIEGISEKVSVQNEGGPNVIPPNPAVPEWTQADLRNAITAFSGRLMNAPTAQGRQIILRNILESDIFTDDGKGSRNTLVAGLWAKGSIKSEYLTPLASDNNPIVAARALAAMGALYQEDLSRYMNLTSDLGIEARRNSTRSYINQLVVALKAATTDVSRNRIIAELTSRDLATTFYKLQLEERTLQEMVYEPLEILASTAPAGSVLANAPAQVHAAIDAGMAFARTKQQAAAAARQRRE
jgi:hypothetical protein